MNPIRNILVVVDPTAEQQHVYLPTAIVAAAAADTPPMAMTISAEELAREAEQKRELLQGLIEEYRVDGERIHLKVGGPAEVLPRMAGALRADIVTMGALSRSGLKRVFLGSTAEDVLEHLPCDALIVKPPGLRINAALLSCREACSRMSVPLYRWYHHDRRSLGAVGGSCAA